MSARTPRLAVALALVLGAGMALAGAPAQAARVNHDLEASFSGADAPGGPFQFVFGIAIDSSGGPSDGDVYVAEAAESGPSETLTSKVYEFDEDGAFAGLEFDGADTPQGSFSFFEPESFLLSFQGLAVDNSPGPRSGDLYVSDVKHRVIDLFDEDGHYVCQITGAATPSASECNGAAGSATPAGGLTPGGIAVDEASGDLYVVDTEHKVIDRFDDSGRYMDQITDPHLTQPATVALNRSGAVYIANGTLFGGGNVVEFDTAGNFVAVLDEGEPIGVGVDAASGHVYTTHTFEGENVVEYDSAGNRLGSFGAGEGHVYSALAVNPANGRQFAGQFGFGNSSVDVYSPDAFVPEVSTDPATGVVETDASLSGDVDPDGGGEVVSCRFEYGPTTSYGQLAPCVPPPPHAGATHVSAALNGLKPSTIYHYRLTAANAAAGPYTRGVDEHSGDGVFVTQGPPTIDEESASNIERTAATLAAKISSQGSETEFKFEFVDATHFAEAGFASPMTRSTPFSQLGSGLKPLSVNQGIGSLSVGTTYHFRAVAVNARGTATGSDITFTTQPVTLVEDQWAYAHLKSATLEAKVNPLGLETSCQVQYVADADFQRSGFAEAIARPCAEPPGAGSSPRTVVAQTGELRSSSTYHFRFAFANTSGSLVTAEKSFATFGIEDFTTEVVDAEGHPYTQAGGHPYESITHYAFNHTFVPSGKGATGSLNGFLKDVITEQPPGRVHGTASTPRCPGYLIDEQNCSGDAQVGTITVEYFEGGLSARSTQTQALYNAHAPTGIASRYASSEPYTASDAHLRTGGDYGINANNFNLSEEARLVGVTARVWGVPADPRHDPERHCPGIGIGCASHAEAKPLLRNPTYCGGPLTSTARVDTWQSPGEFVTATDEMPAITGCDQVQFDPSLKWRPTTEYADSPSGLHVDIHVPQDENPHELSVADLRDARITLSKGLILNPSAANGLVGCAPAQIDLHGEGPAQCPEASKVGLVEIITPLLDHPVHGGIYLATPHENPFDSLFAIYLAIHDPETGVVVKLAGRIDANAGDGQLTTTFTENPQLPVEDFKLDFFGGPRGVLRTPVACGEYTTRAVLTPWSALGSAPAPAPTDTYRISSGPNGTPCIGAEADAPGGASFHAGTVDPIAGAYTPFVFHLSREDGTQQIADLRIAPPPGLLGRLAGLSRCSEAALAQVAGRTGSEEQAHPSCPAQSEVGSVAVGAGAGAAPYYVHGRVYLAGPYKGAPLSLAVVVPAVAGPYDLGTVVVRAALRVDLESGQIEVESEPLPTFLEGVSLDVRSIAVKLDRPRFTLNPTSCAPLAIGTQMTSPFGRVSSLSQPFQVGGCRRLGFAPKLGLRLFGKVHRGAHPSLRAVLRMPEGGANVRRVSVTLPPTEFFDNRRLGDICTREQFAAEACPGGSAYGYAKAWSPLLDEPLRGPVYLRSSGHRLPDMVADLRGELRFALAGRIDSALGGIRTSIEGAPDAPISKFTLQMKGGDKGLLQNSVNVCTDPRRATVELEAQDGRVKMQHPLLAGQCP